MSNLKDTDIDDLFRRASEKYPLRTDSSDWDRMAAALEKDPPPPDDETETDDRRRKRRFFWLFFFLPLGVGGLGYYAWHSGARSHAATTAKASVATNTPASANTTAAANIPSATETRAANPTAASATPTPTTPTTTPGGATAATPATGATNSDDRNRLAKADRRTKAGLETNTGRQINTDRQSNSGHQTNADRQSNTDRQTNTGRQTNSGRPSRNSHQGSNDHSGNSDHQGRADRQNDAGQQTNATQQSEAGGTFADARISLTQNRQDRLFYDLQREPVDRNYQLKVNVIAPAAKKDSTAAKQKTSPKPKTSYLYAGLIVAPDLSTVKMQSVKEVGNTFGALIGYAFNSHWAIETGVYLERKKYYTEGQYFSKTELNWNPNYTLNNVNGTCNMWEIPLNLRYTFNPASKTRWFATAGFTTYLMTKEKYTYNYSWSGWTDDTSKTIKTPSRYPFSIIGLSVGFEQKLGKIGNLRIEPYLRIPLTGMGVGKLPIMSTGINIGITRQLWKK